MKMSTVTREYRLAQWAQLIQERIASGLKVAEFCEMKGLKRDQYYYWLRILRETAYECVDKLQDRPEELALPAFTEVKLSGTSKLLYESDGKVYVECNSCKISADAGYPVESLATLLRELVRL